jgi:hypothetical protein
VSNGVFITTVIALAAANVAAMVAVAKLLGDRIGDLLARQGQAETRADQRHDVYIAKFDGLAETVARFDERVKRLEQRH